MPKTSSRGAETAQAERGGDPADTRQHKREDGDYHEFRQPAPSSTQADRSRFRRNSSKYRPWNKPDVIPASAIWQEA
jgi:hypothetical protein